MQVFAVFIVCGLWVTVKAAPSDFADVKSSELTYLQGAEISSSSQPLETEGKSEFKLHLIPIPAKTAESVNLEKEGIPSKILSAYDNSQKKLVDNTNPVPIIDSISEHEKYGNTGDMFDGISRALVGGYEAFSNLLNTIIQKPKEIARSISKGITSQLDVIGGKLVGL